ncbi:MAG: ATP-binding cassette domain-containing protein [Phycisphaeraceae bacterium]|nr:ATP-binding cassette domain-containing protein [Phycisphaeraceae bacterium]
MTGSRRGTSLGVLTGGMVSGRAGARGRFLARGPLHSPPVPILTATNIAHRFGTDIILDGSVNISVEPGDRIGLVGRNGCGKSTLLKIMAGILKPDGGEVVLQRGMRAGYLEQDPNLDPTESLHDSAQRAFAHLHALHREMHEVYEQMAHPGADIDRLMKRQAQLEAQIEAAGGYTIEPKIAQVLHGLGFTDDQFEIPVGKLSGGQRGRLALATLLLQSPDVLLLDEPTNHLDIEGCIWLEEFLVNEFRGAVLMVSHDRYLLDRVVQRIEEVEQGRLIDYPGNYAKFRELRAQRRTVMLRAFEAQQDKFRKEEAYIRRYKAGQRAKQARGRETKLERAKEESTLERPMELDVFNLRLPKAERTGDMVVSARGISKKYTNSEGVEKVLFTGLELSIQRGERWGIIGPNGAGKTTLVRCLLGEHPADEGLIRIGSNVKVGYYRQTHDGLDLDQSVCRYLQGVILKEAPTQAMSEQQARDLAGAFLFSGSEQDKHLRFLSGGERSRAVLAGLLASAKNLIVLDEPTNHLDIPSAERLEEALSPDSGYEGTLILISHDRALIDHTCDHLIILDGQGGAEVYAGTYTDWKRQDENRKRAKAREEEDQRLRREQTQKHTRQAEERRKQAATQSSSQGGGQGGRQGGGQSGSQQGAQGAPKGNGPSAGKLARMKMEQIEAAIEKLQTRLKAIDTEMAGEVVWRNPQRCHELGEERAKVAAELEPLEFEWARRAEESA